MDPLLSEYLANVAADLTMRVLGCLGRRTRDKILGTPREQALRRCFHAATIAMLPPDDPARPQYEKLLCEFFASPVAARQLANLVRGRRPNQRALRIAFGELVRGRDLPPYDFATRLSQGVEAFLQAADLEPDLKDTIQTTLMRDQLASQHTMALDLHAIREALELSGAGQTTVNTITTIQQNFTIIFQAPFTPPADLEAPRADYLDCLRASYGHLDIKGIVQVQRVAPPVPLAAVYVPLKARAQRPDAGETWARIAGRPWRDGQPAEVEASELMARAASAQPVPVEVALQHEPAVVVLGDPGAGKSTLLKILTLALADQADGPLPILLPLNAYARRLTQREDVNLCAFLGEFYATRWDRLARVGELFRQALQDGRAVILLDGLDEVQARRNYVVELVRRFAAEWIPQPHDRRACVPPGNRLVVTSRIVGYDEAPLSGEQWRVYTLTDFDRADIERFVKQWTFAFEIGVAGGDTPQARKAAESERHDLLEAIFSRPSVERLAANPLLLTILALIKRTGVVLPEQRARLYELYLQALIESWNLARSLDQYPVGEPMNYLETVQVLAPLALWLRKTNPGAGLVSQGELEKWLTDYYCGREWALAPGPARPRGRELIEDVRRYSSLLIERGERQYGFLHLTLEEMLAAKGIAQLADATGIEAAAQVMTDHLADPAWRETLLLAVGVLGVVQQHPAAAGRLLQMLSRAQVEGVPRGANVVLAGEALLDAGETGVTRPVAAQVVNALVSTMQDAACHIRQRRDAGVLLGRLGWRPGLEEGDCVFVPEGVLPDGLDAFRQVDDMWIGKHPVTSAQYARFVAAGGYAERHWWTDEGRAWRTGSYDSKAPKWLQELLKDRPPEKRDRPLWWLERCLDSPLQPVVGVCWFEVLAYCAWLTAQLEQAGVTAQTWSSVGLAPVRRRPRRLMARLPHEAEWERAAGGRAGWLSLGRLLRPGLYQLRRRLDRARPARGRRVGKAAEK